MSQLFVYLTMVTFYVNSGLVQIFIYDNFTSNFIHFLYP